MRMGQGIARFSTEGLMNYTKEAVIFYNYIQGHLRYDWLNKELWFGESIHFSELLQRKNRVKPRANTLPPNQHWKCRLLKPG